MNKAQAEQIPLSTILEKEGFEITDRTAGGRQLWYSPNPLREESDASFNINLDKNAWHDFGTGKGGGVVQFVEAYTGLDFKDSLGWLRSRFSVNSAPSYQKRRDDSKRATPAKAARYSINKIQPLQNVALLNQLAERRISATTAQAHLQEAYYRDNEKQKQFFGTALGNQSGSWEIRNSYVKTCIGNKDFTFVRGMTDSPQVQVFEGVTDFLSYCEMQGQLRPDSHCIILNSLTMAEKAAGFIADMHRNQPREVVLWLDNEAKPDAQQAVETARQHFAKQSYPTGSVSYQYGDYKDLNDYWTAKNPAFAPQPEPVEHIPANDDRPGQHETTEITRRQQPGSDNQLGLF